MGPASRRSSRGHEKPAACPRGGGTAHRSRGHGGTEVSRLAHGAWPLAGATDAGVWRQGLRQGGRRVVLASQPSAEQARGETMARPRGAVRVGRGHRGRGQGGHAASHRGRLRVWQVAAQVAGQGARRQVLDGWGQQLEKCTAATEWRPRTALAACTAVQR